MGNSSNIKMWQRRAGSWVEVEWMGMGSIAAAKVSCGDPLCPPCGVQTYICRWWVRCQTHPKSRVEHPEGLLENGILPSMSCRLCTSSPSHPRPLLPLPLPLPSPCDMAHWHRNKIISYCFITFHPYFPHGHLYFCICF